MQNASHATSETGLAPDYMHAMFTDRDSVTSIQLRDTENKLAVPMPRTNYLKNSFSYSAVLCCAVLCCAVLCCAVLCCAVLCCAVLCCAVLCCAVLCCAVLCCAVLCCAVEQSSNRVTASTVP